MHSAQRRQRERKAASSWAPGGRTRPGRLTARATPVPKSTAAPTPAPMATTASRRPGSYGAHGPGRPTPSVMPAGLGQATRQSRHIVHSEVTTRAPEAPVSIASWRQAPAQAPQLPQCAGGERAQHLHLGHQSQQRAERAQVAAPEPVGEQAEQDDSEQHQEQQHGLLVARLDGRQHRAAEGALHPGDGAGRRPPRQAQPLERVDDEHEAGDHRRRQRAREQRQRVEHEQREVLERGEDDDRAEQHVLDPAEAARQGRPAPAAGRGSAASRAGCRAGRSSRTTRGRGGASGRA